MAILCSCIPTLKGLVQRLFPELLSATPRPDKDTAGTASTDDSMFKSKDSDLSNGAGWRVGKKLSVSAFADIKGARAMEAFYSSRISEEDEESGFVELASLPGKSSTIRLNDVSDLLNRP